MDQHTRRDGQAIEEIGFYDPLAKDKDAQVQLNDERAKYWLSVGAQPTDTVRDMLRKKGLVEAKPIGNRPKRTRQKRKKKDA